MTSGLSKKTCKAIAIGLSTSLIQNQNIFSAGCGCSVGDANQKNVSKKLNVSNTKGTTSKTHKTITPKINTRYTSRINNSTTPKIDSSTVSDIFSKDIYNLNKSAFKVLNGYKKQNSFENTKNDVPDEENKDSDKDVLKNNENGQPNEEMKNSECDKENKDENIEDNKTNEGFDSGDDSEPKGSDEDKYLRLDSLVGELKNKDNDMNTVINSIKEEEDILLEADDNAKDIIAKKNVEFINVGLSIIKNALISLLGDYELNNSVTDNDGIFTLANYVKDGYKISSLSDPEELFNILNGISVCVGIINDNSEENDTITEKFRNLKDKYVGGKDKKNPGSIKYYIYKDICKIFVEYCVDLQNKILFLFPSLFTGEANEFTVSFKVKGSLTGLLNIGDNYKLIKRMSESNIEILKQLFLFVEQFNLPILKVDDKICTISVEDLMKLESLKELVTKYNKNTLLEWISKYVFDLEPVEVKNSNKTLKSLLDNSENIDSDVSFKFIRSKENKQITSFILNY